MGREGGSLIRRSSGGGGGGAGGAGLLSLFNFHSVVGCSADDTGFMYCSLMSLLSPLAVFCVLTMIAYIAYLFLAGGKRNRQTLVEAVVVDVELIFLFKFYSIKEKL